MGEDLDLDEARARAASKIAAMQRGNVARTVMKQQHEAAVKLQARHRGLVARRRAFHLGEASHLAGKTGKSTKDLKVERTAAVEAAKPLSSGHRLTLQQLGLKNGLPRNPVPSLRFLTFQSWWTEMGTKRYMELCFDLETELFQVILDKQVQVLNPALVNNPNYDSYGEVINQDTKVMSMHLHEKLSGSQHAESLQRPHLECWDLHVGCRLNVLGRPTTLMQCNLVTAQWLEDLAEGLARIKTALAESLRKYETVPMAAAFSSQRGTRPRGLGAGRGQGSTDLRTLLNRIAALSMQLKRYRPHVATRLAALVDA